MTARTRPAEPATLRTVQWNLDYQNEVNVDLFAGAAGASTGYEIGTGRCVDIAINHDENAIQAYKLNHPHTKTFTTDIFEVDPQEVLEGRPVGHLHMSPDCTHHSQAAGGQPRKTAIRALAWVGLLWVGRADVRKLTLENVEQILNWGPLVAKRCPKTGRVVKLDRTVAAKGERVPVQEQFLVPCKKRQGQHWKHFISALRSKGYEVEWRKLSAADHGTPTTRERLFLQARKDGVPLKWPEPTHFKNPKRGQKKWRSAAECIDWSIPGNSIFDRPRPLADATMRRIAKGVKRYVLDAAKPFIVPIANFSNGDIAHSVDDPLRTITAYPKGGTFAVVAPTLVKFRFNSDGGRLDYPLPTITAGGNCKRPAGAAHALGIASVFLAQYNNHRGTVPSTGRNIADPMSTVTTKGCQQSLITANLVTLRHHSTGHGADEPIPAITASGNHSGLVQCQTHEESGLSPQHEAGALKVYAFLMRYYSEGGQWSGMDAPMPAVTTKDRMALVTVYVQGVPHVIVDITLRMLQPHELFAANGFPPDYIIDRGADGRKFSKAQQIKHCGNSVPPPLMTALSRAMEEAETEAANDSLRRRGAA